MENITKQSYLYREAATAGTVIIIIVVNSSSTFISRKSLKTITA